MIAPESASAAPNVDLRAMVMRTNVKADKQTAAIARSGIRPAGSSSRRTSLFPVPGKFTAARLEAYTNVVIFYYHRRGRPCVHQGVRRVRRKDYERVVRRRNGNDDHDVGRTRKAIPRHGRRTPPHRRGQPLAEALRPRACHHALHLASSGRQGKGRGSVESVLGECEITKVFLQR